MRLFLTFFFITILLTIAAVADSEVDYLALSAVLVNDGNYDRAKVALEKIDTTKEDFDWVKYHTVYGLYYFALADYTKATELFKKSVDKDPKLIPFLAQAELKTGHPERALKWLDRVQKVESENIVIAKFQALSKLKKDFEAFEWIQRGCEKFPANKKIQLHNAKFLIEKDLIRHAELASNAFLDRPGAVVEDFVHFAQIFSGEKRIAVAEKILQRGSLRYPYNEKIGFELAFLMVKSKRLFSAYQILSQLSRTQGEYFKESAEIAKQTGRFHEAIFLNSMIADQKDKVTQRLAIEIAMQNFAKATAMVPKLSQLNLLERDEINYAVAYSHYNLGQFDIAAKHLAKLQTGKFFEQANTLRKAMADCGDNVALCL